MRPVDRRLIGCWGVEVFTLAEARMKAKPFEHSLLPVRSPR